MSAWLVTAGAVRCSAWLDVAGRIRWARPSTARRRLDGADLGNLGGKLVDSVDPVPLELEVLDGLLLGLRLKLSYLLTKLRYRLLIALMLLKCRLLVARMAGREALYLVRVALLNVRYRIRLFRVVVLGEEVGAAEESYDRADKLDEESSDKGSKMPVPHRKHVDDAEQRDQCRGSKDTEEGVEKVLLHSCDCGEGEATSNGKLCQPTGGEDSEC